MTYRLKFLPVALKEWEKLAPPIRAQFQKKLAERLETPKVLRRGCTDSMKSTRSSSGRSDTGLRIRSWTMRSSSSCWPSESGSGARSIGSSVCGSLMTIDAETISSGSWSF